MKVIKEGISLLDNDNEYIDFIGSAIKLADPMASVKFNKSKEKLNVSITPSTSDYKQHLVDTVLEAHRRLHLKIHYSSSLKISKIISFYLVVN